MSGFSSAIHADGNLPYVDQKLIHFGFLLGVNSMDFGIKSANGKTINDSVRVQTLKPGFTVGIITDLRLNRYLNLRFTPTLHFSERQLIYNFDPPKNTISISSIPICFPIYLKYSAERKDNYRPYIIWGGGVSYDLSAKSNSDDPVLLKPINFYTEFGVGCDIYFSFFKLSPELKYSIGLNDILVHDPKQAGLAEADKKYSRVLYNLTSRMITLSLNFE